MASTLGSLGGLLGYADIASTCNTTASEYSRAMQQQVITQAQVMGMSKEMYDYARRHDHARRSDTFLDVWGDKEPRVSTKPKSFRDELQAEINGWLKGVA